MFFLTVKRTTTYIVTWVHPPSFILFFRIRYLFRFLHPRGGLGKTHFSRLFEPYPKGPVSPLIMAQSAPNDGYMVSMKEGMFRAPPIRR